MPATLHGVVFDIFESALEWATKALLSAITQAVHESIGAPIPSIRVWIAEMQPTEFMAGGELLADRQARAAAT